MKKLNDVKQLIKSLEESILDNIYLEMPFMMEAKLEDLIVIRKTLLWVIQLQPRKKKDTKSAKLEDFDIQKPI